jgi:hypothetical protein
MAENLDFNDVGGQRVFDVIPANTICTLQINIRLGGAGDDGWLTRANDGGSEGLDCEFTVVEPTQFVKRKLWQRFTLRGSTQGHGEAGEISRTALRAILESARGIKPDDKSEAAQSARRVTSYGDFDGLRFMARVGLRPPKDGYPAKNTILEVLTPDHQAWRKSEQISKPPNGPAPGNTAAPPKPTAPSANAIARPQWGD